MTDPLSILKRAHRLLLDTKVELIRLKLEAGENKFIAAVIQGVIDREDDNLDELNLEISSIEHERDRDLIEREERADMLNNAHLANAQSCGR